MKARDSAGASGPPIRNARASEARRNVAAGSSLEATTRVLNAGVFRFEISSNAAARTAVTSAPESIWESAQSLERFAAFAMARISARVCFASGASSAPSRSRFSVVMGLLRWWPMDRRLNHKADFKDVSRTVRTRDPDFGSVDQEDDAMR